MHDRAWHLTSAAARARVPLVAALIVLAAAAQGQSNRRERWLKPAGDTLRIDTLSLVPGSLSLWTDSAELPPARYTVLPFEGLVVLKDAPDSLLARYRVLPLLLGGRRQHKDPARLTADPERADPFRYTPPRQDADPLGLRGLQRSGSISRGVLFGNNQDLSVSSTLNLQLGGRITDRIGVAASITDSNIPIQATRPSCRTSTRCSSRCTRRTTARRAIAGSSSQATSCCSARRATSSPT
ncbi:MAG: hypothetical protein ACK4L7_00010 [Flavobacteriales bacterium]